MKKIFSFLFLASSLFTNISVAQTPLNPGVDTISIVDATSSITRKVIIVTPNSYNSSMSLPVVFFMHGLGGDKYSLYSPAVATAYNIIAIYPEGTPVFTGGRMWNSFNNSGVVTNNANDTGHLRQIYDYVSAAMGSAFNPATVYGLGFSNGGSMLLKMNKTTSIFKALVIGSMTEEVSAAIPISSSPNKIPMLFMHGMSDAVVPFEGGNGSYGPLATFESMRNTVNRWAAHNQCDTNFKMQFTFEGNSTISSYHFREYRKTTNTGASVYTYIVPNADHAFGGVNGFTPENIFNTAMRFFTTPNCYGFSKEVCSY